MTKKHKIVYLISLIIIITLYITAIARFAGFISTDVMLFVGLPLGLIWAVAAIIGAPYPEEDERYKIYGP